MIKTLFKIFIFLLFNFLVLHAEQITEDFRLDGYANIQMVDTDRNRVDDFKLNGGVQGRYQLTDDISITGQVHFKEGENSQGRPSNSLNDYKSELKWLYVDYYLKDDIILRAGAFQFPVFKSSETGDIGYTYTWTHTPLSFYGVFGCDDFEGVEVLKKFSYKEFDFLAQLSYGQSTNNLDDGRGTKRDGEADNLIGLTLKTTHDNFILNLGYIQAESKMDVPSQIKSYISDKVNFDMYALESEIYLNDYTLKSGLIKTNLSGKYPEDLKYYTSLEYNYKDFTPYILYSREDLLLKSVSGIPPALEKKVIKKKYTERYSIGVRYDYNANIALKASYIYEIEAVEDYTSTLNKNTSNAIVGTINVVF